jgi:hypothetical protein
VEDVMGESDFVPGSTGEDHVFKGVMKALLVGI